MAFHQVYISNQGACDCLKSNCLSQKEYERWLGISGEIESLEYHFLSLVCSKSCRVKEIQALFLSSQNSADKVRSIRKSLHMRVETLEAKLSLLLKEKPTDHGTHSALDKPCTNDIQVHCYRHGGGKLCCIAGCKKGSGLHSLFHLQGVYEIKPEIENESYCLYVCDSHFQSDNLVHSLQTTELPESQLLFKQLTRLSCSLCYQGKHLYIQNPCPQHMLPFLTKRSDFM